MKSLAVAVLVVMLMFAVTNVRAASWEPVGWGGGGCYWSVVFDPHQDGVLYMGGDVAGAYKSEDHGRNWRMINNGLANFGVYSLAIDRKTPGTLYAATQGGLCKSTDAGESWKLLPNTDKTALRITGERNKSYRSVAIDPTDSNTLYAGSPVGKVYKSFDGGQTWKQVYQLERPGTVFSVAVSERNPAIVLAATETAGIVLSEDAGQSWRALQTPVKASSVTVAATDGNVIVASFFTDGVWKSIDAGKTWTNISQGIDPACSIIEVAISPMSAQQVYAVGKSKEYTGHFYASDDGGATWSDSSQLTPDSDRNPTRVEGKPAGEPVRMSRIANIAINPLNSKELFLAANWRSVWSGDGGRTWEERNHGADISCVADIRFHKGRVYTCAMDEGVFVSETDGASWKQLWPLKANVGKDAIFSGHYWRLAISDNNGRDRIVSTASPWNIKFANRLVISEDGGKTFKETAAGLPDYRPRENTMWGQGYARALAVDPANPKVMYLGIDGDPTEGKSGGGIFRSNDGGYTWKQLASQPGSRRMFYGLVVDPTDSNRLFWGAAGTGGGLYISEDAGESWKRSSLGEGAVFNVLITQDGTVYAPGRNLWRSNDHGRTWTKLTDLNEGRTVVGLEIDPRDSKTIWISAIRWGETAGGSVLKTTDGGATWTDITGDIGYPKPIVLRFDPATNELWAGGNGLFKIKQ